MGIADAVKPVKSMTQDEMGKDVADQFAKVTWGTPGAEADNKSQVTLQLKNALDNDLVAVERIRLTCSDGGAMAPKAAGNGTVLSGDGTADMIVETDESTGSFDLEVTYVQVGTISVVGGATQGSGFVSCRNVADLVFA